MKQGNQSAWQCAGLVLGLWLLWLGVGAGADDAAATDRTDPATTCQPLLALDAAELGAVERLSDWEVRALTWSETSRLTVVDDVQVGRYLRVASSAAAAFHYRSLDPRGLPTRAAALRWRWRTAEIIEQADLREADADDSALRVFVVFSEVLHADPLAEGRAIFYSWANRAQPVRHFPSHLSERIVIWPLRGPSDAGSLWRDESRDLAADYRAAFGADPPPLAAVGFVSDTDQTGAVAVSDLAALCLSWPSPEPTEVP